MQEHDHSEGFVHIRRSASSEINDTLETLPLRLKMIVATGR